MSLEGSQLGRYQLHQILGSGGMGEVYLAEDSRINRQVAIKVVRSEPFYHLDEQSAGRAEQLFEREMKVITQLDHPHILPLYDYGDAKVNGTAITYMVMPYRPEGSLLAWLQQQQKNSSWLSLQDVANLIEQAASALYHAHERQVIHQDVKPSNFLIRVRPEEPEHPDLLLTDFGISRFTTTTSNTSQFIQGTPAYMAPEHWRGHPTYASDQYALAVMSYELMVGHPPFEGRQESVMYKHMTEMPPEPSALNGDLPPAIDTVLLQALAKEPEARFASVAAFASAFQSACTGEQLAPASSQSFETEHRSSFSLLASARTEAEQDHMNAWPGRNMSEVAYREEQAAPSKPVAMSSTPLFMSPIPRFDEPPLIEHKEVEQPMASFKEEAMHPHAFTLPHKTDVISFFASPLQGSLPLRILLIGLAIVLICTAGGLTYHFVSANTTTNGASYVHSVALAATSTAQADHNGGASGAQTSVTTTAHTQTHTGSNANAQMTAQAQAGANLSATQAALANARATAAVVALATPLYRLYRPGNGDHFYTTSAAERDAAISTYGYQAEGITGYVFNTQVAHSTPLYRLVNASGHHFYTMSASERDNAVAADGYHYEGIASYVFSNHSSQSVPLYRLYNPGIGDHFYTASAAERDRAVAADGYQYEGIAGYMLHV